MCAKASAPTLPKGVRDFGVEQMAKREYIFSIIEKVFKKYGFSAIQTPAMENLSVLTGKYGDEGDQLIFKILNSGDFLSDVKKNKDKFEPIETADAKKMLPFVSEKALRYDLTVPFARYVVMNRNDITLPFKRYQIQPVWRADRPQKGRYREFYQCDADVVGTHSLLCEAEIVLMIQEVFNSLGISNFEIQINNRKILSGLAQVVGAAGNEAAICTAIDKLDKIGLEGVEAELLERGITQEAVKKLLPIVQTNGSNEHKIETLKQLFTHCEAGMAGVNELEALLEYINKMGAIVPQCTLNIGLARGLSYYTGAIFEVKALDVQMGSVCGGGRYDNLAGLFGWEGISGVGISFGVDRIFDVMNELQLFPEQASESVKVLLINFSKESENYCLPMLRTLRKYGIAAEMYYQPDKLKKQFSYADAKKIPFILVAGDNEIKEGVWALKNMQTGEQTKHTTEQIIKLLL